MGLFLAKKDGNHKLVKDLGFIPAQWSWNAVKKRNSDLGVPVNKNGWLAPEEGQTFCMII